MSLTESASQQSQGLNRSAGNIAQTCPAVTLEIGVFFDGTGNNAANVRGPSSDYSDSYNSSLSNVVLLNDLYQYDSRYWTRNSCGYALKRDRIYVQGIGTTAKQSGLGPTEQNGRSGRNGADRCGGASFRCLC